MINDYNVINVTHFGTKLDSCAMCIHPVRKNMDVCQSIAMRLVRTDDVVYVTGLFGSGISKRKL